MYIACLFVTMKTVWTCNRFSRKLKTCPNLPSLLHCVCLKCPDNWIDALTVRWEGELRIFFFLLASVTESEEKGGTFFFWEWREWPERKEKKKKHIIEPNYIIKARCWLSWEVAIRLITELNSIFFLSETFPLCLAVERKKKWKRREQQQKKKKILENFPSVSLCVRFCEKKILEDLSLRFHPLPQSGTPQQQAKAQSAQQMRMFESERMAEAWRLTKTTHNHTQER